MSSSVMNVLSSADLLGLILEKLNTKDLHKTLMVSKLWYNTSKKKLYTFERFAELWESITDHSSGLSGSRFRYTVKKYPGKPTEIDINSFSFGKYKKESETEMQRIVRDALDRKYRGWSLMEPKQYMKHCNFEFMELWDDSYDSSLGYCHQKLVCKTADGKYYECGRFC